MKKPPEDFTATYLNPLSYDWRTWPDKYIEQFIAQREDDPTVESVIDEMREELEERDEYRAAHDDTPSLQDSGNELGSYGT